MIRHESALIHGQERFARDGRDEVDVLLVGETKPTPRRRRGGGSIGAFPRAPLVALGVALLFALGHLHEDVASEKVGVVEFQRLLRRLGGLERDVTEPARFALIVAAQSKVENLPALSEKLSQRPLRRAIRQILDVHRLIHVTLHGPPIDLRGEPRAFRLGFLPPNRAVIERGVRRRARRGAVRRRRRRRDRPRRSRRVRRVLRERRGRGDLRRDER